MKNRIFSSKLSPYILGLISEKRACGYSYEFEAYILELFDRYIINGGYDDGTITEKNLEEWSIQRSSEGVGYHNQRISFVAQLSKYMISMGIDAYVPSASGPRILPAPRSLTPEELHKLLITTDAYKPRQHIFPHQAATYSVIFRVYACCGLRLSEPLNLQVEDTDLENNILVIRHSKGDKDRQVFMADDLSKMCQRYDSLVKRSFPSRAWFFVSSDPDKHIDKTVICNKFSQLWKQTGLASNSGKNPSVHSLRHTYVEMCINKWMESGIDVQAMMPYLSKQLGHSSVDGTQYYYHTAVTSTHLVRMLDKSSNIVIPKIDGDIIKNPVKKKIATSQERVSRRKPINPMNTIIKRAR